MKYLYRNALIDLRMHCSLTPSRARMNQELEPFFILYFRPLILILSALWSIQPCGCRGARETFSYTISTSTLYKFIPMEWREEKPSYSMTQGLVSWPGFEKTRKKTKTCKKKPLFWSFKGLINFISSLNLFWWKNCPWKLYWLAVQHHHL